MLTLKDITKHFNGNKAVDKINFEVKSGEVVGFLGPNGAGKTTTMRMIATLLEPDDGVILLDGEDIHKDPLIMKRRLGFMPENNPLYTEMLVSEYLEFIAQSHFLKGDEKDRALATVVRSTGIGEVFYKPISDLSKGYRQRVGLAQAIIHKPDILILDEPTEGLDPNQRGEIRKLIKNLGKDRTVILSTHLLQEVTETCDRVIIIHCGRIVADGTVDELITTAQHKSVITLGACGLDTLEGVKSIQGLESIEEKEKNDTRTVYEITAGAGCDIRLDIFEHAKVEGWKIFELHQKTVGLEEVFRELTNTRR